MSHKKNIVLEQLLDAYEKQFNKPFPISAYLDAKDENVIINEIRKCIDENKPCDKEDIYITD